MSRIISKDSIKKANNRIINGHTRGIEVSSKGVSLKCKTQFGNRNIFVAKEKITSAGSTALRNAFAKKK